MCDSLLIQNWLIIIVQILFGRSEIVIWPTVHKLLTILLLLVQQNQLHQPATLPIYDGPHANLCVDCENDFCVDCESVIWVALLLYLYMFYCKWVICLTDFCIAWLSFRFLGWRVHVAGTAIFCFFSIALFADCEAVVYMFELNHTSERRHTFVSGQHDVHCAPFSRVALHLCSVQHTICTRTVISTRTMLVFSSVLHA